MNSRFVFKRVDVTDWESFRNLFDATIEKFGIVHAVISNAGMHHEALLKEEFDDNGRLKSPNTNSIDINLVSHLYASKLAFHYFKKGKLGPRQIVYTGSAASYIDTAPLYQYGAAKAGTLGLMRAFRQTAQKVDVSVNMVAPWMTGKLTGENLM
jgi:NAD(P)-dependent dehydrogenase (short-subunit alcohol dehydrogenase family)